MNNFQKFIGILLIVIGIGAAGIIFVHSTIYDPSAQDSSDTNGLATSTLGVGDIIGPNAPNTGVDNGANSASVARIPGNASEVSSSHLPLRLIIPSISVNAGVQYVGQKSNGEMANPSNFTDVGWYKNGTVPGEIGSAVIAGHLDNALALSGVFKHLGDVKQGDDVYVARKDGTKLHFVVDKIVSYPYKDAPSSQIFLSSDGKAHLNLITCAGTWIKSAHSYSLRMVVYTTLVK